MTIKREYARSQMTVLTVLVFGPELVSYERSRRETGARINDFSARAFFEKHIPKSAFKDILYISVFQDTYPQNGFFPYAFQSPDPATRRPVRSILYIIGQF